jgi:hypothetical protein
VQIFEITERRLHESRNARGENRTPDQPRKRSGLLYCDLQSADAWFK